MQTRAAIAIEQVARIEERAGIVVEPGGVEEEEGKEVSEFIKVDEIGEYSGEDGRDGRGDEDDAVYARCSARWRMVCSS